MNTESKESFSSSESDFNDDSDLEDLGLGNDDLSAHIKDWTSGAQAYSKSSQFVIEEMEQDTRVNNKKNTTYIINQIDNQFVTDSNVNEQDSIFTDITDHTSNTASRKLNFHEATGTATIRKHDKESNSLHQTSSERNKSKSKSSNMKKMSISGRKSNKSSKASKVSSRKTFQSIPQVPDDDEDFYFDDSSSYNKRTKEILSKPSNVDDIANQYLFSSKKTIRIPSSFSKLKRLKKGKANYDDLLAQSDIILKGTITMSDYAKDSANVHRKDYTQKNQETVVFTYDEDLHDFVPSKGSTDIRSSKSNMNQWWKSKKNTMRTASRHTNKNFDKMIRFSSDRHKYGLREDGYESDNLNNRNNNDSYDDLKSADLEAINARTNFRAAIIFISFFTILTLIFLIGMSLGRPWVDRESHDQLPELDIDYREKVTINGTNNDDIDFEYNDDPDLKYYDDNISETEFLLHNSSNDQPIETEDPIVSTYDAPTASPHVSDFPINEEDMVKGKLLHKGTVDIFNIIQSISSIDILNQSGTAQNKAITWLTEIDLSSYSNMYYKNPEKLIQRFVVIMLYYGLGGDKFWVKKDSWLSEKHECEWFGVNCMIDEYSLDQVVIGIDLKENGLSGSMPSEIGYLKRLKSLSLPNNKITGQMPPTLLQVETLLELYLNDNQITGLIPKDLGLLKNLENLNLSANRLKGNIPNGIGNMEGLIDLRLSKNELTGEFPLEILDLVNLRTLLLDNNMIEGEISKLIGGLQSLQILRLSGNELYGSIPKEIGQLSSLRELFLDSCDFTGSIPSSISQLQKLEKLVLSENDLSDKIPKEIGSLTNLEILRLDNNPLGGPIHSELGSLRHLRELHLESTSVFGNIPNELKKLDNIVKIGLENNLLDGPIPSWLGEMGALQKLSLNNNKLSGTIPEDLSRLNSLDELRLEKNFLIGEVPSAICALKLEVLTVDCDITCSCCTSCND